jgi:dTDP-4-dehydrorhamnose reductase
MKKILVTGAGGFVGSRVMQQWAGRYELCAFSKGFLAVAGEDAVRQDVLRQHPDVILHTAAISDTGYCTDHPAQAYRANVELPVWLAWAAVEIGAKLVAFSSDQVYAGVAQSGPLSENIPLQPANVYGQGKLEMEQRVQAICPSAILLRATWMYDLPGYQLPVRGNLPLNLLRAAQWGEPVRFSARDFRGITYVRQAVTLLEPAMKLPGGVYNFGSENAENMVLTARQFAETLGITVDIQEADWARNLAMDCSKLRAQGIVFDTTQAGLERCLRDYGLL